MKKIILAIIVFCFLSSGAYALSGAFKDSVYNTGEMKPVDSVLKVKVGDAVPDFALRSVSGKFIAVKDYFGEKNVVISFVPAAWTPVCSDQWPGYNIVQDIFDANDAVLLGITVDNIPTLYAWIREMGALWFEVLSDFWPHGAVAEKFGVLRSDGMSERAIIIIDKKGIIRYIDVHNINQRPPLESIVRELEKLN